MNYRYICAKCGADLPTEDTPCQCSINLIPKKGRSSEKELLQKAREAAGESLLSLMALTRTENILLLDVVNEMVKAQAEISNRLRRIVNWGGIE